MHIYTLERSQVLRRSLEETYSFFSDATNLEAITPDWLRFKIITPGPIQMRAGTMIEYQLRWRGVPMRWVTIIEEWEPPHRFVDVQLRGPYKLWEHEHTFDFCDEGTRIGDVVRYALPLGFLGRLAHYFFVRRDLERVFDYRARKIGELLESEYYHA